MRPGSGHSEHDWTRGPGRLAAVIFLLLGGAFGAVGAWSRGIGPGEAVGVGAGAAVDLNSAAESELDLLPGVGPALAKRIVEDRRERGAFKSVDDLERVRGIGPKIVERVRAFVRVGGVEAAAGIRRTGQEGIKPDN